MIEIEPFAPRHMIELEPRLWPAEREALGKMSPADRDVFYARLRTGGPCFTLRHEALAIAAIGLIVHAGEPVATAWTLFTPDVRPVKKEFESILSHYLTTISADMALEKVKTSIQAGYEHLMPWVRRLGFVESGKITGEEQGTEYELCL